MGSDKKINLSPSFTIGQIRINKSRQGYQQNKQYAKSKQTESESAARKNWLKPEFINIHDLLVVRFQLPLEYNESEIEPYIVAGELRIKWQNGFKQQIIPLPGNILYHNAKAILKNKILEVRFPLNPNDNFKKIDIQNM